MKVCEAIRLKLFKLFTKELAFCFCHFLITWISYPLFTFIYVRNSMHSLCPHHMVSYREPKTISLPQFKQQKNIRLIYIKQECVHSTRMPHSHFHFLCSVDREIGVKTLIWQ